MWWFVYFVLLGTGLIYSKFFHRTLLSPIGIYSIVWNGLLFLGCLPIVEYVPISLEAHILYIFSFLLFLIGDFQIWAVRKYKIQRQKNIKNENQVRSRGLQLDKKITMLSHWIWIYFFLSLIGLLWFIYDVLRLGGIFAILSPAIFRVLKLEIENRLSTYLLSMSLASSLLSGISISHKRMNLAKGIIVLLPPFVFSYITGARFLAMMSFFLFISPILLTYSQISSKKVSRREDYIDYIRLFKSSLVIIVLFFLFFVSVYQARSNISGESPLMRYALLPLTEPILIFYIYVTGPFYAFSEGIKEVKSLMYGQNIMTPFAKLLTYLKIIASDPDELKSISTGRPPAVIPFWFNTYTYLYDWYKDFGVLGTIIGPYLLGLLSGFFYQFDLKNNLSALVFNSFIFVQIFLIQTCTITSFNNTWIGFLGVIISLFFADKLSFRINSKGV